MQVIYVAGAYRGKSENDVFENIMRARTAARHLWLEGYAVICPHMNTAFMGATTADENYDNIFLDGDLEILRRCDAIYMLKGWEKSAGAIEEYRLALEKGLTIVYEH